MIQHVNISNEYINDRKNHGIKILNQYKSINTINMSKSQVDIKSEHASNILNVQSRDEHPLIVQSNATFASL